MKFSIASIYRQNIVTFRLKINSLTNHVFQWLSWSSERWSRLSLSITITAPPLLSLSWRWDHPLRCLFSEWRDISHEVMPPNIRDINKIVTIVLSFFIWVFFYFYKDPTNRVWMNYIIIGISYMIHTIGCRKVFEKRTKWLFRIKNSPLL